ncbi:MAG: FliH/SctL family protein [Nitrospiraceae bacterium]|nr:FliH/SctL family protein [Nitrospiraceae bacterium]
MWNDGEVFSFQPGEIIPFEMPVLEETISVRAVNAQGPDPAIMDAEMERASNLELIERQAYEKGFHSGEQAGYAMGEQKALVLLEKLEGLLVELSALRKNIIKETEPKLVELALGIARKVVAGELQARPEEVLEMAKEGLSRLEKNGKITIHINPFVNGVFMKNKQELLNIHPEIVFEVDSAAPKTGAVIMSQDEEIDTGLDELLKNVIKEMSEKLGSY